MLKSFLSLSPLRYPQVVKAIAASFGGTGLLTLLFFPITLQMLGLIGFNTLLCIAVFLLVERYYVPVVFSLCLLLNLLAGFSSISFYLLNSTSQFSFTVMGIILGGLLLGGRGATIVALFTLLLLSIGELTIVNRWLPAPAGYTPIAASELTIGIFYNAMLVVLVYLAVVFFAHVIRQALSELSQERNSLTSALTQLQDKQALERQTGSTLVGIMASLSSIAQQQLSSVQEQVAALAEVTTTVEELSTTALQIANSAGAVEDAAVQALNQVGTSQEAVSTNLNATLLIKTQVQHIVERIITLNESIQNISEISNSVSGIAAQTHLLALNAAIEAAGAGPQGERFATVAAEVKKLANRSQVEADKIRELVISVQQANAASVMATEQGMKDADKGTMAARTVAEANLEVIELVEATSARAKAITLSTQQQRSASSQVVETMRQLRGAAKGIEDSAASINESITELSTLARQLGTLINT